MTIYLKNTSKVKKLMVFIYMAGCRAVIIHRLTNFFESYGEIYNKVKINNLEVLKVVG